MCVCVHCTCIVAVALNLLELRDKEYLYQSAINWERERERAIRSLSSIIIIAMQYSIYTICT